MSKDLLSSYKKTIDNHSIVSFDLFDTLVERPMLHPTDLFNLINYKVEELLGLRNFDFKNIRILSEKNAYKKAKNNNEDEINFEKIYLEFKELTNFSDNVIQQIKDVEKSYEVNYSIAKNIGMELFQYALKQNKKILIISDIYFDSEFIKQILLKHNYHINEKDIFLSSEIGFKKSSGLIFDKVRLSLSSNGLNISKDNWLHVGDNEYSDITKAKEYGINTLFISSNTDKYKNSTYYKNIFKNHRFNSHFHLNFLHGFNSLSFPNRSERKIFTSIEELGYSAFGPLLIGFTQWLIQKSIKDGIKHLYFLARDGKIIKDAYDIISENYSDAPKSYYILSSRKSTNTIKLTDFYEVHNILKISYTNLCINDLFIQRFSLDLTQHEEILAQYGYSSSSIVSQSNDNDNILELIKELYPFILKQAKYEKNLYIKYLETHGLNTNENCAVVDIGYTGTMQASISNLLNKPINGYYLITFYEALDKVYKYGNNIDSYLANFDNKMYQTNGFIKKIPLYETLFSSEETSFLGFKEINGEIYPIYQEKEINEDQRVLFISLLHKSALNFVKDFSSVFKKDLNRIYFDPNLVILPLKYFFSNGSENEELLKNVYFEDKYSGATLNEVGSYYQELKDNFFTKLIIFTMCKFLPYKKQNKLKNNPAKFFMDSKKASIKLVGKLFFGIKQ